MQYIRHPVAFEGTHSHSPKNRYVGFDGYDRETGEAKGWSAARGADIWLLETCDSIKVGTKAWNKKTSLWLLRYVYTRNRSRLGVVYVVSAIWHGFYPGTFMVPDVGP